MGNWKNRYRAFDSLSEYKRYYRDYQVSGLYKGILKQDTEDAVDYRKSDNERMMKWYGSTDVDLIKSGDIKTFIDPELPLEASKISKLISSNTNFGDSFKKDRMITDSMPIGVFSFALATKGLYKGFDFYSDKLESVVDKNKVRKSGEKFIYENDGEPHEVRLVDEVDPETGEKVYKSKIKKVYQRRAKKGNSRKVSIFIPVGGSNIQTPESLAYRCLPPLIVASILEQAGIKVGIYSSNAYNNKSGSTFVTAKLKDYGDKTNYNKILIATSDSRYFRYNTFGDILKTYDSSGVKNAYDLSNTYIESGDDYLKQLEIWKAVQVAKVNNASVSLKDYKSVLENEKFTSKYPYDLQTMISPELVLRPNDSKGNWMNEIMKTVIGSLCQVDFMDSKNAVKTYNNALKMQESLKKSGFIEDNVFVASDMIKVLRNIPSYNKRQRDSITKGIEDLRNV